MKKVLLASAVSMALVGAVHANEHSGTYAFDTKGAHQFVTFKISHLGYSWLYGRFNDNKNNLHIDKWYKFQYR